MDKQIVLLSMGIAVQKLERSMNELRPLSIPELYDLSRAIKDWASAIKEDASMPDIVCVE